MEISAELKLWREEGTEAGTSLVGVSFSMASLVSVQPSLGQIVIQTGEEFGFLICHFFEPLLEPNPASETGISNWGCISVTMKKMVTYMMIVACYPLIGGLSCIL